MSFVDVRDCAAMHVAALGKPEAAGRYICVAGTATERRTEGGAPAPRHVRGSMQTRLAPSKCRVVAIPDGSEQVRSCTH